MHDLISCDLCQRTILKGERIETFVGSGDRQRVCELCSLRALRSGWVRETELERQAPERERLNPRRSLWSRAATWAEDQGIWGTPPPKGEDEGTALPHDPPPESDPSPVLAESAASPVAGAEPTAGAEVSHDALEERRRRAAARAEERRLARRMKAEQAEQLEEDATQDDAAAVARRPSRAPQPAGLRDLIAGRRREPRHVQAVPSGRWPKIELALEMFNDSEHRRTMAGVGRTLGEPWVSAAPLVDGPEAREVGIIVAWEISWYRFRVDLDDTDPAVELVDRGNELGDLNEPPQSWDIGADAEGRLALAVEAVS